MLHVYKIFYCLTKENCISIIGLLVRTIYVCIFIFEAIKVKKIYNVFITFKTYSTKYFYFCFIFKHINENKVV